MADIFREVDEDLKRERYLKLWRRYGKYMVGAAAAIVLATAAGSWWREHKAASREADGARYVEALILAERGKVAEAANAFAALAEGAGGAYPTLARLHEAGLRAKAGDREGALGAYEVIAADSSVEAVYHDLAVILIAFHSLDAAAPAALAERLAPLTVDSNPWRYSARELTAILSSRAGDHGRAKEIYTALMNDPEAPASLRGRASEMLGGFEQ